MQTSRRGGAPGTAYKPHGDPGRMLHYSLGLTSANMVRFFSVDWLAQSHFDSSCSEGKAQLESETDKTLKPHVPCMVQPSAPSYGKGYLQPKPKTAKNPENTVETGLCSSPHSPCASPVSEISEYSSGYESEAASSECSAADDVSEAEKDAQNQRRVRTKFTPEQINKLEKIFNKHKYLDGGERVKTAQKLNLTETQVRTWFQNRRMKLKREVQDYLTPQVPPMLLHALPPALQFHRPHYAHHHPATAPSPAPGFYPMSAPHMLHHHHHSHPMMMQHPQFY